MKVIFLVILGALLCKPIVAYTTKDTLTVKIEDKDRECNKNNECRYVIYTDLEVFENRDSVWFLKWNSSDVYNDMKKDGTYEITVTGFRIPFFSSYRNIVGVSEING